MNISKKTKENQKGTSNRPKVAKTCQQSIPYIQFFNNGIVEVDPDKFSRSYHFEDINFKDNEPYEQDETKDKWGVIMNLFSPQMDISVSIFNRSVDKKTVYNDLLIKPEHDNYNGLREGANEILRNAVAGSNNLITEKYLTVSFKAKKLDDMVRTFNRLDKDLKKEFVKLDPHINLRPMKLEERLSVLYDLYNPYNGTSFERRYTENSAFSLENMKKAGLKTKDIIGCPNLRFDKDHIELGDGKYARTFYIVNFPPELTSDFVCDMASQDCSSLTTIHIKPLSPKKIGADVRNKSTDINKDVVDAQKTAAHDGYGSDLISVDLQDAKDDTQEFIRNMSSSNQKPFLLTFQITLFANTMEELENCTDALQETAAKYSCDARIYRGQMEIAFDSCLPFANNKTTIDRLLLTDSVSIFLPFSVRDIAQKGGIYFGTNQVSHNIIKVNQNMLSTNMNKAFLGISGSGKSMQAKSYVNMQMLCTQNDISIIDPNNEWLTLAALYHDDAEVIHLKAGSTTHINPLDLDISDTDENPVAQKCEFMHGFMSIVYGDNYVLSPTQKSILNRCIAKLYEPYLRTLEERHLTIDRSACPTLVDLYDLLHQEAIEKNEPEANEMATALEMHCSGPNAIFAYRTNINPSKRLLIYNIKELQSLKALAAYVCIFDTQLRMFKNAAYSRRAKTEKYTDLYIDEFQVLMEEASALNNIAMLCTQVRKFGGSIGVITQNISNFFESTAALKILNNVAILALMNQGDYEREKLAEIFNLSDGEKKYITNAPAGTGIVKIDDAFYPFENIIPEESVFYKAMSTKLSDAAKFSTVKEI